MPGSNGNSKAPEGIELFEKIAKDGGNKEKIDKKGEFKEFEKVIDDKETKGKEILVTEVTKEQGKVLNLFDEKDLNEKIKDSKDKSKDVKDAYKVLRAYKKGKKGSYEQVLEQSEGEESLLKAKQKILSMIDKNNDWSPSLKETARTVIEDLFDECDSVEEFERRAGRRLQGVEDIDDAGDFFKSIPELMYKRLENLSSTTKEKARKILELMKETGYEIKELGKKGIELGILKRNEFIDWCKEKGQNISDITKTICERGKDQFKSFINYLKEKGEDISQALRSAWEWSGGQWSKFVNWCGGKREDVKDMTKELFDLGLIKLHEFADRCKNLGEQGKQILINVFEWNKNLVKDFVNWCSENWDFAKEWFKDICKSLIEKSIITVENFVERCKNSWEKVKDAACVVLVYAHKVLNIGVGVLYTLLIEIPKVTISTIAGRLMKAGKEIYKAGKEFGEFIGDVAVAGWERAKGKGIAFAEYMKGLFNTLKSVAIEWKNAFDSFMRKMREGLKNAGISAMDFVKATCVWAKGVLIKGWEAAVNVFKAIGIKIETTIQAIREAVGDARDTIVTDVIAIYKGIGKGIKDALTYLGNTLKIGREKICKVAIGIKDYFVAFIDVVKNAGLLIYENISKWLGGVRANIKEFYRKAIDRCGAKIDDIYARCSNKFDIVRRIVNEIFIAVKGGVKKFVEWVGKGVNAVVSACEWLAKIGIGITAYIVEGLREACKKIGTLAKALWEKCSVAARNICEWINNKVKDAKRVAVEVAQAIADATSAAIDWVKRKINAGIDEIKYLRDKFDQGIKDIFDWLKSKGRSALQAFNDLLEALADKGAAVIAEVKRTLKAYVF